MAAEKPESESQKPAGSSENSSDEGAPTQEGGQRSGESQSDKPPRGRQIAPASWVVGLLLAMTLLLFAQQFGQDSQEISYSYFDKQLRAGNIASVSIQRSRIEGTFVEPPTVGEATSQDEKDSDTETSKPGDSASESDPEDTASEAEESEAPADDQEAATTEENQDSSEETSDQQSSSQETDEADDKSKNSDAKESGDKGSEEKESEEVEPKVLAKKFFVQIQGGVDAELRQLLVDNVQGEEGAAGTVQFSEPVDWGVLLTLFWFILLIGMVVMMFSFFRRTRDQMMGGGMLGSVTKSPARRYDDDGSPKVTFDDVAGLKGVKLDLKEIVEFLRTPEKFQRLGARVPKGVLLCGPPGTGKTLLAKAVAGEAGVPFFSINGSEFIQLFVGVGASRVRDMFKTAKKSAPAILFIDEIDAIGRQRGAGVGGGHDEREQTLNQILSEMDGFSDSETVIVIAATNRPDVLDPALLRPGRFDRHVTVDRPSIEGRRQLFDVHAREIPVGDDVDFDKLARATVGLTGADIANLVNEAALWATRQDRRFVTMEDFEYARDKALMGSGRDDVLSDEEKRITAFHEAGHTLAAWLLPGGNRVHKVTIIPRGRALGVTQLVPDEDRHNMGQNEMHARLAMLLAGRAAEKIVFDEYSAGAENDLKEATKLARRMVTKWGMSDRLGPVAFQTNDENPFLGREHAQEQRQYSEHTAQMIDDEVAKILHAAADRARRILTENRPQLDAVTDALLEHEEIDEADIIELIGPSVQDDRSAAAPAIKVAPPTPSPAATRDRSKD